MEFSDHSIQHSINTICHHIIDAQQMIKDMEQHLMMDTDCLQSLQELAQSYDDIQLELGPVPIQ